MKIVQKKAFKAKDIKRFMKQLGNANGNDCSAYGDNATIHTAAVEDAANHGVHMFFNHVYRPDLCAIEQVWKKAKLIYRQEVSNILVRKKNVNNLQLVKKILGNITSEECSVIAAEGWRKLVRAKPIDYEAQGEEVIESDDDDATSEDNEIGQD